MGTVMKRWDLINNLIIRYHFNSFLEIGHDKGEAFDRVNASIKVSVDPNELTKPTYIMSSDDFFELSHDKFDIIFIDGLHEHSQVYRDIVNSLNHLNQCGCIILHDYQPDSEMCQRHAFTYPGGAWTGDCWKAFVKARATLPYELYVWDYDWGCGVIDTNLPKISSTGELPAIMANMSYTDFTNHPEWMNFTHEIK